jgi:membrane protein implicated in regulation of membrane protease activity
MSGGQIAALILAIVLLLPGACYLIFGISAAVMGHYRGVGPAPLIIGALILSLVAWLFWIALRRRPPSATGGPPRPRESVGEFMRRQPPTDISGPPQTPENPET